jgi:branched-chain amino acid transport system substrate-binding protein
MNKLNNRFRYLLPLVALLVVVALVVPGCADGTASDKDEIKIGCSVSLSGIYSSGAESLLNAYKLWEEQVNADGGIYVDEYEKKLPVKLVYYDDKSLPDESIKIYGKLIDVDKVDLCLPPWGTSLCVSLIPVMEQKKMPWVACTSGGKAFVETPNLEYSWDLDFLSYDTAASVEEILVDNKDQIETLAVLYEQEVFMVENRTAFVEMAEEEGFDIVLDKDYPAGVSDLSGVLQEIQNLNPDAVIAFCYPAGCFLMLQQAMEIGVNPKFFYAGVGPGIAAFPQIIGPEATDGICLQGTWSQKLDFPGAQEFYDAYMEKWGIPPDNLDSVLSMQGCEILQQAIEKAGSLDTDKVRDVIATEEFMTIDGPVKFAGERTNSLARHGLCQWQNGIIEVVWPLDVATADLLIPKPEWPK